MKIALYSLILLITLGKSLNASANFPFEVEVTGTGPDLILIPGLACPGEIWNDSVEQLKSSYTCHIISLPGMGGTPASAKNDQYLESAKDGIIHYIREYQLKKPGIIGHSLGGFLALMLGINFGDELSKLVIVDSLPFLPAAMNPMATVESAKPMAEGMRQSLLAQTGTQSIDSQRSLLSTMISDSDHIETVAAWNVQSDTHSISQAMYELHTIDLRDRIKEITTPTIVLGSWIAYKDYGRTKEATTAVFVSQFTKHPNCKIVMSDRGKHFIMLDDPEFFLSQTKTFLAN